MSFDSTELQELESPTPEQMRQLLEDAARESSQVSERKPLLSKRRRYDTLLKIVCIVGALIAFILSVTTLQNRETIESHSAATQQLFSKYDQQGLSLGILDTIVLKQHAPSSHQESIELIQKIEDTSARMGYQFSTLPSNDDVRSDGSVVWIAQ